MAQNTIGETGKSDRESATSTEVFRYKATIRLDIETATFEFNPAITIDARRIILRNDPGWRVEWPPRLTGAADRDDLILAFSRIVAALGLRAGIAGASAAAIKAGLFEMFSSVPRTLNARANTELYRRFAVDATIQDDGSASWTYGEDRPGMSLPGVDERPHHLGKPGVEIFVQNLIRADLLYRIEKLRSLG